MSENSENKTDNQAGKPLNRTNHFIIQAIVGGIIGSGLLVAWVVGYLTPILTAENKVNEQQNKVALLQIEEKKIYLQRTQNELEISKKAHQRELELLKRENRTLQDQLALAKSSLEKLVSREEHCQSPESSSPAISEGEIRAEITNIEKAVESASKSAGRIERQIKETSKIEEQIMPISWVKPSNWIGQRQYLEIDNNLYLWPTLLNSVSEEANIIVNTSNLASDSGRIILKERKIGAGEKVTFTVGEAAYVLKLISIRKAGFFLSDAAYFEAIKVK